MKKLLLLSFFLTFTLFAFTQTIQEAGVTVEYEFNGNHLRTNVIIAGVTDQYKIHIFMDDSVNDEGLIGFVSTDFKGSTGYVGTMYSVSSNNIDFVLKTLGEDFKTNQRGSKMSSKVRNKQKTIIALIRKLLIEAWETEKLNLTNN
jgi:hypothetical protein